MRTIRHEELDETLIEGRLPDGLTVTVWPKPGFRKVYAVVAVRFGSLDCRFRTENGEEIEFPAGVAHFLEHQMFEGPNGGVFAQYAAKGASANAFTGYERTAYLFSATDDVPELLGVLLDAVQTPRFTDESIEKEKGIITQEIMMYRDHPDWQCHHGLLQAMYWNHPVRVDIAGTAESVGRMTKAILTQCHAHFYHPANMHLVVAGGVEPDRILERVRSHQTAKTFTPFRAPIRQDPEEPAMVREREHRVRLPVSMPKCMIGFKSPVPVEEGKEGLRREIAMRFALETLVGKSSDFYQELYEDGLATDVFSADFQCGSGYAYTVVGGETPRPDVLAERVRDVFWRAVESGICEEAFERVRRKKTGGFLRLLQSPEAAANEWVRHRLRGTLLFDVLDCLDTLTAEETGRIFRELLSPDNVAISVVSS